VIKSELVKDGGMKIVHVDLLLDRVVTMAVGLSV